MPTVKSVGEPCAREPHARFEVAAGGNQASRLVRAAPAPLADPTLTPSARALADSRAESGLTRSVSAGGAETGRARRRTTTAAVRLNGRSASLACRFLG